MRLFLQYQKDLPFFFCFSRRKLLRQGLNWSEIVEKHPIQRLDSWIIK